MAGGIMENKVMDKKISDYWKVIQLPAYVSIALSLLSALLLLPALGGIGAGAFGISMLLGLIGFVVWLWAGWRAVKEFKYGVEHSAVAGALGGAVSGFIGAVIILVLGMFFGTAMGASVGAYGGYSSTLVMGGLIAGLITTPIVGAIFGAILAGIGAFAAQNVKS